MEMVMSYCICPRFKGNQENGVRIYLNIVIVKRYMDLVRR